MKEPGPVLAADLFLDVRNALIGLLRDLSEEDWLRPTVNPSWTVKDIAAHLLGGDISNLSRRRDGFRGTSIQASTWDELVAGLNQLNEIWVQAARRFSPRMLIEFLEIAGSQICGYFASLNSHAMGGPVSWAGPEPAAVWLDIAREYTERWHHQQQMRDAVGKPGLTSPMHLSPVIQTFVRAFPHSYRDVPASRGTRVRIVIFGPSGGVWSLVREAERYRLYIDVDAPAHAEVQVTEEDAWKLLSKTLDKETVMGRAGITGEGGLCRPFFDAVSVIA